MKYAGTVTESAIRTGRPRSERARLAVLDAAADLLFEAGLPAATIEAIAARAGVSKVTIYKWWTTRGAVLIDAYFHRHKETIEFEDSGDIARDLATQIRATIIAFRGSAGAVMAELIGQAQSDPVLAETLRERWVAPRREAGMGVLERGVERKEIRRDLDLRVLMDQLYAPVYFRLVLSGEPLDVGLADSLVSNILQGVRQPGRSNRSSRGRRR